LPKVFGDASPRQGPFDRSSVWIVRDGAATLRHDVPCDTLQFPELRRVLRLLFAGTPPANTTPNVSRHTDELLRIEWREQGQQIAVSQLFADGMLVREEAGKRSVDRLLQPGELQQVREAVADAGLRDIKRTFCSPEHETGT
jgi:hypothetical protein